MAVILWVPSPEFQNESCYLVGGGPSLESFDWDQLRGRNVIGCNVACYRSPQIIPWVLFGDASFLAAHREALEEYVAAGGQVVTNSTKFRKPKKAPPWLKLMKKQTRGLGSDRLGWNGNTGASAINLALLMGAKRIYLLVYDMKIRGGKANYHNAYNHQPNPKSYMRFIKGMRFVARDLPTMFPGRRVINLEDNTSALDVFPKESLKEHFAAVPVGGAHG